MFRIVTLSIVLSISTLSMGCIEDNRVPQSLAISQPSGGAKIVFDLDARPFPEIPFPNNLATRTDPTSPTGKRINVSFKGSSDQEEEVRKALNKMTGFGVVSPLWVRFDSPIDLQNIVNRHQEAIPNLDDDAVYLVNVDKKSPGYGEIELLDLGRGNFPILMKEPDRYFPNDPREMGTNLLFESVREIDLNGNGVLDPIEDTDDDGVWDEPNLLNPAQDPYDPGNTLEWYEKETNTLIIRALKPLRKETTYAVVLTSKLIDINGLPIDSPFPGINHTQQNQELEGLHQILPEKFPNRFTQNLTNVRFAWSFTTQDPTKEMLGIRAGLYGEGKFSYLKEKFPAELKMIHNIEAPGVDAPLTYDLASIIKILLPVFGDQIGPESSAAIEESYQHVDYVVSGSYISPYFMADKDGLADTGELLVSLDGNPQDDDEAWNIDPDTGKGSVGEEEVTFICSVPKTIPGVREPPFNTMLYSHAISSTRLELILFAGSFAKFGFAACVIDAVGHGVVVPSEFETLLDLATKNLKIPNFPLMLNHHRARDLNNDGIPDSGGKAFSSDLLHSRDNLRQTAVDQVQLIRILRTWNGTKKWADDIDANDPYISVRGDLVGGFDQNGDGKGEIAGDFNGDGIVDFGGDRTFVAMGTSLGGIQTSITAAVEPTIRTAASNSGGGVVGELASRTTISNVRNGGLLRLMGPLLTGHPFLDADGKWTSGNMFLGWTLATADEQVFVPLGIVEGLENGYRIVLRNPNREKREVVPDHEKKSEVYIRNGTFRVGISADAMMATERRARLGLNIKISARDDIMGCRPQTKCGETTCPDNRNWTCTKSETDTCMTITNCVWEFDPEELQTRDDENQTIHIDAFNRRTVKDPTSMGDPLIIEIYDNQGELVRTIDTFLEHTVYENIIYPEGAPLAAITEGFGLQRQTPNFRKFLALGQTLLEGADPAVFAPHYFEAPFSFPYEDERFKEGTTNFLMMGTIGDQVVPISNSLAIARSAGIIDLKNEDGTRKMTQNQFLVRNSVYEGVAWFNRFVKFPDSLFDPDDLDNGTFKPGENKDADDPLRITISTTPDRGVSGLRLSYLSLTGAHTFNAPTPAATFDAASFMTNLVTLYLANSGSSISDDPCMADLSMKSCTFMDIENFTPQKIK